MRLRLIAALVVTASTVGRAAELPPAYDVTPVEVVRTGDYSEGVVVDHDGNLYFSHRKVISRLDPSGKLEIWAETGAPNGHKVLADGTHLVCDGSHHAVLHLDALGREMAPASKESDGKPLRAPNDLTLDPKGGFYFTDPGGSSLKDPIGTVHHVDPDGVTHTVASGLAFPNGIALRPDGKELLVAESQKNRILAFPVESPGQLGEPKVLIDLPPKGEGQVSNEPDGICLDEAGNLYVAHHGMRQVQVVSPNGELIRRYPAGNLRASNVAFAGRDRTHLFLTGGEPGALFRLDLGVKGLEILPPRAGSKDKDDQAEAAATISGKVFIAGRPATTGIILFAPAGGRGAAVSGTIQPDGSYSVRLQSLAGAASNTFLVAVQAAGVSVQFGRSDTTPLRAQVRAGAATFDFNLAGPR